MSKTEISQKEYQKIMGNNLSETGIIIENTWQWKCNSHAFTLRL